MGRQRDAGAASIAKFQPYMLLVKRVYYMRGINYVYHDANAAAVAASAALNARISGVASTPTAPALAVGTPPTDAQIKSLSEAVTSLSGQITKSLGTGGNIGVSSSFARATAEGIEMTEIFERPLAFGYVADAAALDDSQPGTLRGGIARLCGEL